MCVKRINKNYCENNCECVKKYFNKIFFLVQPKFKQEVFYLSFLVRDRLYPLSILFKIKRQRVYMESPRTKGIKILIPQWDLLKIRDYNT